MTRASVVALGALLVLLAAAPSSAVKDDAYAAYLTGTTLADVKLTSLGGVPYTGVSCASPAQPPSFAPLASTAGCAPMLFSERAIATSDQRLLLNFRRRPLDLAS